MIRDQGTSIPWRLVQRQRWVGALLLFALAVLAYLPSTRCDFIWDDDLHLTQNPCIIGPLGLQEIWTSKHASLCPLVLTTFWVEHRFWGLNPLGYHVVNVLMHAGAALVLWRVLLILKVRGAWLGAALWALHPVQVASVAWISEMKNTQSGLFFLLSILFYCKWRRAQPLDENKRHRAVCYGLTLVFGALALASKSSTVVLPLVLGLCAWWVEGCWSWRRDLRELVPLLLMSLVTGVVTMWTQKLEGAGWEEKLAISGPQRVVVAGRALWFYLGKLVWPHPLVMIYPRWEISVTSALAWLPAIAAVVVTVALWRNRKKWNGRGRALWLGWAYFGLALLPVLGLVEQNYHRYSFVADHLQYLASMGPLVLVGAGISAGLAGLEKHGRWLEPALCAVLLLSLGGLTWHQCTRYQNEEVLWTATLPENPSCWVAHNNLGTALQKRGQADKAIAQFERALEIQPGFAEARNNLGNAFLQKGQLDKATEQFQKALEMKPDYAEAQNSLGLTLQQEGRLDDAMLHYQNALQILPAYAEAHNNLGNVLMLKGQAGQAVAHYDQALASKPDCASIHFNLARAFQQEAQLEKAILHFEKAIAINPHDAQSLNNLAYLLAASDGARLRDGARAVGLARLASRLTNESDPTVLGTLAAALAETGNFSGAVETVKRATMLAEAQGNPEVIGLLQQHLKLYQDAQPLRIKR